jgi:LysR family nitrogen assimilation transcriptional regulator
LTLTQLRYFLAVARNGSVTKASTDLSITQPAVSRQLRLLEEELGAKLLERHPRGVQLTQAGEVLLSRSEYLLRTLSDIQSEVSGLASEPSGELRLGCPPALSKSLFLGPLTAFLKRHQKVRIQLQERFSDELKDMVLADEIDIAIVSSRMREPNLKVVPLLKEEIWLFGPVKKAGAARRSLVTPAALATLPMLLPRRANTIRTMVERYVGDAGRLQILVESSSNQMIQDLMQGGFGYTAAPYSAHEELYKRGKVWGARIPNLVVERMLVRRLDRPISLATDLFIRLLEQEARTFRPV